MSEQPNPPPGEKISFAAADPIDCAYCHTKPCRKTAPATLDVCVYGISFYNDGTTIKKKKEDVTMRHIAANLRHELNKILHYIISQANIVDDQVSIKRIDLNSPASRIVGATQIIDNFIELICGVYEFYPDESVSSANSSTPINLRRTIDRLIDTYSLIKNVKRARELTIEISVPENITIERLPAVIEYLLAVLIDNVWKYSFEKASVSIKALIVDENLLNIEVRNPGKFIPLTANIFSKGYKLERSSEGFGFGLYWAKILCEHYNRASGREADFFDITHIQENVPQLLIDEEDFSLPRISQHTFVVSNISYVRRK